MQKKVKDFDFSMLQEVVEHTAISTEQIVVNPHFALVRQGDASLFRYVLGKNEPLRINDYRLGLVVSGEACARINLMERHVQAGSVVFFAPGSIVQPLAFSENLRIRGFALFGELPFTSKQRPDICLGTVRDFQIPIDAPMQSTLCSMLDTLWLLAKAEPFVASAFRSMVAAYFNMFNHIYTVQRAQNPAPSHQADLFNRFIHLVNAECQAHHNLDYYAAHLYLTPRYLGNVVKRVSGSTAKLWIDRALATEAKIRLKHSDMPVVDIANDLCFSNAAFFCKFFRRMVGCTPLDYRYR